MPRVRSADGGRSRDSAGAPARAPYSVQRQQAILTALRSAGRVDAAGMAAALHVTGESIRKDLIRLERQGLLRRVHGGAVAVEQLSFEPEVSHRIHCAAEKQRIAHAALAHLPQSGSVLIDAGSTTSRMALMFPGDRELTVFTNTLSIAVALLPRPNLRVYTLGGRVRGATLAEVDDWALRSLAEINVDVAFLGANGISADRGLTTPDPSEAAVKRAMLACARRTILLADHTKIGLVSTCKYGDLADVDVLITDTGIAPGQLRAIRHAIPLVEEA
jgi:DeoR family transcriptional regulator, fructose operon transcriptional repressor